MISIASRRFCLKAYFPDINSRRETPPLNERIHFSGGVSLNDLSSEYDGGYWEYFELANGGFFLLPPSRDEGYNIFQWGNGYEGVVSEQAAGIIATMMVINHLGL